jgi:hypothetical protein
MYFFTYMYLSILIIDGYRLNGVTKSFVDKDTISEEYCALVEIARSVRDNVVISYICPRLDDKDGHISAGNRILGT